MEKKTNTWLSYSTLGILAVLFIGLTILSDFMLGGVRLDLTENKLYTLSQGTRNILGNMDEPVTLRLYFSEDNSRDLPQFRRYAVRVREMLDEFTSHSAGKLTVRFIDPVPFSDLEDEAAQYGLQAVPKDTSGDTLYFGIAGTSTLDEVQVMPFLDPRKEAFLEYDLAKMVSGLSNPHKARVGLLSGLPIEAGFDPATSQMREAWVIHDQLNQFFDIERIDATASELPADLDVLLLIHPKNLSAATRYAIDQFVIGGGRLVAFVDPLAESDTAGVNPNDPMSAMQAGSPSDLPGLLASWGVTYNAGEVVADRKYALQVGMAAGRPPVRHPGILGLTPEAMNQDEIITADLESVNISSAGHFDRIEDSGLEVDTLLNSSADAALMPSARLRFLPDPSELLNDFNPTNEQYAIAVRVSGIVKSAFTDALPEGADPAAHVAESKTPVNVLLFADTDLLSDRFWVQKQSFFGQSLLSPFASNGDLVINAVDNMLGNTDLISIRARATSSRPFDRVEDLRRDAERQFRATEQELQARLDATEQKLGELQASRQDSNLAIMTPEQQAELQRFREQQLQIRKDLREVQRNLNHDIDALGTWLKILNIMVVPLLVVIVAIFAAALRRRSIEGGRTA